MVSVWTSSFTSHLLETPVVFSQPTGISLRSLAEEHSLKFLAVVFFMIRLLQE